MTNNLYFILWNRKTRKYWGPAGQRMGWTDVPKLYKRKGHAINAYRASVDTTPSGHRPDIENVSILPVHLTGVGTDPEKPTPMTDLLEIYEKRWKSTYHPHKQEVVYYKLRSKAND